MKICLLPLNLIILLSVSVCFGQTPPGEWELIADLESGERGRILSATASIQEKRLKKLFPHVYEAFSKSEDPVVRRQALFLMSRAGAPEVPQMVREAIDDPKEASFGTRHLGARELALQRILKTEDKQIILPAIKTAIADRDVYYRKYGAAALAGFPEAHPELAQEIKELCQDSSPVVRFTFFSKLKMSETTRGLVRDFLLNSREPSDIISAAFAVSRDPAWPESDRDKLLKSFGEKIGAEDEILAGAAGQALSFLLTAKDLDDSFFEAAKSSHRETVMTAALFRELGVPFSAAKLEAVLAEGPENDQLRAVALLSEKATSDAIPLLTKAALNSKYSAVRKSAVFGLRSTGWIAAFTEMGQKPNGKPVSTLVLKAELTPEELKRKNAASATLKQVAEADDPIAAKFARDALIRIGTHDSNPQLIDLDEWNRNATTRRNRKLNDVAGQAVEPGEVLEIGKQKQLLIDDFVIEKIHDAERVFHSFQKHPANPVFHAQVPWEENWVDNFMCSVHLDEATRDFKMWYRCGANHTLGGFAVSAHGISWKRPNLGAVEYQGSQDNNLLGWKSELYRDSHQPGHNITRAPDADPDRRYMSFFDYSGEKRGFYVSYSGDGLSWSEPTHAQIVYGDVATLIPEPSGGFLLFPKQNRWVDGYRRSFGFARLKDVTSYAPKTYPFTTLTKQHDELVGREAARSFGILSRRSVNPSQTAYYSNWHTQIYSVTPLIYEGMVLGFYDIWYLTGGREGPLEMLLKATRNRKDWFEVGYPKAFLPRGRPGEWDAGMVYGGSNILVVDDEIRFYYAGFNLGHDTNIPWGSKPHQIMGVGLATLRLDGFASLRAGKGTVTTKPLRFTGDRLELNGRTENESGSISVEVLDENGRPIPGFSAADCVPVKGDQLRGEVKWRGTEISKLAGKKIQLKFHLENAELFAFQFR